MDRCARGQRADVNAREPKPYKTHIAPAIGDKHVRAWALDDLRSLSRYLDAQIQGGKIAWKTARNVWTTAGKMLADAVRSKRDDIRCRTSNPIRDAEGPNRGAIRAHSYLYPSEPLSFVGCPLVPLAWWQAAALAVYTYARAAELRAMRCEDIDFAYGTIHVHRARDRVSGLDKATKTKVARRFTLEPAAMCRHFFARSFSLRSLGSGERWYSKLLQGSTAVRMQTCPSSTGFWARRRRLILLADGAALEILDRSTALTRLGQRPVLHAFAGRHNESLRA